MRKEGRNSAGLINGKVLTSYNNIKPSQLRDEHAFIRNNLLLHETEREKAEHLIFISGLTELRLPQVMIFRGEDTRLKPLDAITHEANEYLNAFDLNDRIRHATVSLAYYRSREAKRIDMEFPCDEAAQLHEKNVKSRYAVQKAKDDENEIRRRERK